MLSNAHPLPLYAQLAGVLRLRIGRGEWKHGDKLPSQAELTREFKVARVTVRQAITLLEDDGLLQSCQGRGTFVTAPPGAQRRLHVHTTLRSLVAMLQGDVPQLQNVIETDAAPQLGPEDGAPAPAYVHMRRVHLHDATPYCVISIYLDTRIFDRARKRFRTEVIIPVLTTLPGVTIAHAQQTLTIDVADPATAAQLGMTPGAPVANVRRVFRGPDGTVIYLGEVTYRGDLVQLDMDLVP